MYYVDVSKELTSGNECGLQALKTLIIQSLVNTIGGYYYTN